jgi:uncharacterized damage-inducible protein DinB
MKETLQRMLTHMQWADEQVLKRFRDAHAEVEVAHLAEAVRLYAHVLAAERLWYLRLQQQDWKVQKVWPMMAVEGCAALAKENAAAYAAYFGGLSDDDLTKSIPYTNTQGESFTNTVGDILLHVFLHGAHHRGQIATTLRRVGIEPPVLDYIRFVRGR